MTLLDESFTGIGPDPRLTWLHEPSRWGASAGGGLEIWTDSTTDFWQRTHYGFQADNGHVLGMEITGDFEMVTEVSFTPVHQYDQAGLLVRFSPDCWLKCSVEFEPDGPSRLGSVVTNHGFSDWSTQDFADGVHRLQFSVRRAGADFHVGYRISGTEEWSQMRICHLFEAEQQGTVFGGVYACSPQGQGYQATFHHLRVSPTA